MRTRCTRGACCDACAVHTRSMVAVRAAVHGCAACAVHALPADAAPTEARRRVGPWIPPPPLPSLAVRQAARGCKADRFQGPSRRAPGVPAPRAPPRPQTPPPRPPPRRPTPRAAPAAAPAALRASGARQPAAAAAAAIFGAASASSACSVRAPARPRAAGSRAPRSPSPPGARTGATWMHGAAAWVRGCRYSMQGHSYGCICRAWTWSMSKATSQLSAQPAAAAWCATTALPSSSSCSAAAQ